MSGPAPRFLSRPWSTIGRVVVYWCGYTGTLYLAAIPKGMVPQPLGPLVWGLASSVLLLLLTHAVLKQEGRQYRDVGILPSGRGAMRLLGGFVLGLAVYGVTLLANLTIVGPIHFVRVATPGVTSAFLAVGTYLALSVMEEVGFRGYPLRSLVLALGTWRAQLLVAAAFSLSHVAFGWSMQAIMMGVFPSALLFGAAALALGDLTIPIGLHAALNLAQWSTGEKGTPGIWSLSVDDSTRERMMAFSPAIGISVTMAFVAALWWYGHRRAGTVGVAA